MKRVIAAFTLIFTFALFVVYTGIPLSTSVLHRSASLPATRVLESVLPGA